MGRPPIHDGCWTVEGYEKRIRRWERKLTRKDLDDEERGHVERNLARERAEFAKLPEPKVQTVYIRKTKPDRWVAVGRMCLACRYLEDPVFGLDP